MSVGSLTLLTGGAGLGPAGSITVVVKVMDLAVTENIKSKEGKELQNQEAKVCDEPVCVRLVMWENDAGVAIGW